MSGTTYHHDGRRFLPDASSAWADALEANCNDADPERAAFWRAVRDHWRTHKPTPAELIEEQRLLYGDPTAAKVPGVLGADWPGEETEN